MLVQARQDVVFSFEIASFSLTSAALDFRDF
jgi:hypothetical protein